MVNTLLRCNPEEKTTKEDVVWQWQCTSGKWLANIFACVRDVTSDARLIINSSSITLVPQVGRHGLEVGVTWPVEALQSTGQHRLTREDPLLIPMNVESLVMNYLVYATRKDHVVTFRVSQAALDSNHPWIDIRISLEEEGSPSQEGRLYFLQREYAHFGIPKLPEAWAKIDEYPTHLHRFSASTLEWKRLMMRAKKQTNSLRFGVDDEGDAVLKELPLRSATQVGSLGTGSLPPPGASSTSTTMTTHRFAMDTLCTGCLEDQGNQLAHMHEDGGCLRPTKGSTISVPPVQIVDVDALLVASKRPSRVAQDVRIYFGCVPHGIVLSYELHHGGSLTFLVPSTDHAPTF